MPPVLGYQAAKALYGLSSCMCGKPCKLVQSKKNNGNRDRWGPLGYHSVALSLELMQSLESCSVLPRATAASYWRLPVQAP